MNNSLIKRSSGIALVLYVFLFLLLSIWAVRQPQYTWDLVGYIGCSINATDARTLHDATFEAIQPVSSGTEIQPDNPYRRDVKANPYHFAEQLPFYSIKAAYVVAIQGLHRAGLNYPKAAAAVSAISNFLLALLLWRWLSGYISGAPLFAACTLIMLSPNLLELSRWATPDLLSTLVAALGLYLILERDLFFWGGAALILNVWVRTDALVLAGVVLALLWLRGKIDFAQFATLSILGLTSYLTINHFAGNYGWSALFYNSFLGGLTAPGETIVHLSSKLYLHQVVRGAYLWLVAGGFALYVLLGGLAIWLNRNSFYSYIVGATLLARAISYVLYPNGDQRYTAVQFVLIPVALVIAVRSVDWTRRTAASDADRKSIPNDVAPRALESAPVLPG